MKTFAVDIILDGILDRSGSPVPSPGHSYWIAVIRYKVINVFKGEYKHSYVLVGHDGADMALAEFQPGVKKRLELSIKSPQHAVYNNSFANENPGLPVYFCLHSELIK